MRSTRRLAQQTAYCLRHAGVLEMTDKRGNAIVYTTIRVEPRPARPLPMEPVDQFVGCKLAS